MKFAWYRFFYAEIAQTTIAAVQTTIVSDEVTKDASKRP